MQQIKNDSSYTQAWQRFFARMFDVSLYQIIIFKFVIIKITAVKIAPSAYLDGSLIYAVTYSTILFSWAFIEAVFLNQFGATLGKWLFNIKLTDANGKNLAYVDALQRSIYVWFRGMAIGLPIINMFTYLYAFQDVMLNGKTAWDKKGNIQVHYKHSSDMYYLLMILVLVFIWCRLTF